jgi:outer membrane protein
MIPVFHVTALPAHAGGEREIALEEAYHSALQHNERISASGFRVDQAQEDIRIARSTLMPQILLQGRSIRMKETSPFSGLGIPGGAGVPDFSRPDRYNEASIHASQPLFRGGRLRNSVLAARYASEGREFEDYRIRQQILFTVSNSFYNVLFARRSTEIAENQLTRSTRHLELAQQRQEVGLVDITAVLRARVQVAAALEALEQARNNYTIAMEQLALEMGIDQPPASVREPESLDIEAVPVETHIAHAFANRRDLMASEKGRLAAERLVNVERGDFLPSLSLEGSYLLVDDDAVYYGDNYTWQVALVASYPLFTGLRDTAELARARARESEMQAAENRIRQEIRLDVRSAYADIQTRKKMVQHISDQVESARAHYDQVSAMFEEGLASTVDVVDAETALNEAELGLASVYYQLQLDHLSLQLATGAFLRDML